MPTVGISDLFLNEYVGLVDDDTLERIAVALFDAFQKDRTAMIAKDYVEHDKLAEIVKGKISNITTPIRSFNCRRY